MSTNFNKFFTTYEQTDPPPVISDDYKQVEDLYKQYKFNPIDITISTFKQEDPLSKFDISEDMNQDLSTFRVFKQKKPRKTSIAQNVVDLARSFVGTKYSWGGSSPTTGFDCSGLIQYVYKQNGINIPRSAKDIEKTGVSVSLSDAKVGDIICTPGSGSTGKHTKIISKIDNGQIYTIEAKGKKYGIIETPLTNTSNITTIRRVLNNSLGNHSSNYIIDYFVNKGLTRNQAKGIYGNLMQESGGNISAKSSDGHNSYGLAQWTGSRKQQLFNKYGSNPSAKQQLDFLWWELNNTHKDAFKSLKQTTTVYSSTKVFMDKFERPHKNYANFSRRLNFANSIK